MNWKRIISWGAAVLLGLILVLLVGGFFVLRSDSFHRYLLGKIEQQAAEATGGKVVINNFDFSFSSLTAHAYGLTIRGTEAVDANPLLHVDKLTAGLKIVSVLHKQVNLNELLVEHPAVNLMVDKEGRNNIPQPNAPKTKASHTNVFDLAVGHMLLSDGEINYSDRKMPLNADLRNLRAETHFDSLAKKYSGTLSYRDGHIRYAGLNSLPHSFGMQFEATTSNLNLPSLLLTVGSSKVSLQASISNFIDPTLSGKFNILIHTQDVAGLAPGTTPSGDLALSGNVSYHAVANHSFLRDVALDGQLNSEFMKVVSSQARVELRKLNSRYQLTDGKLETNDFAVDLLNGRLTAKILALHVDTQPVVRIHTALNAISLQAVSASLATKNLPLTGTVQGTADASWTGNMKTLQAHSDVNIQANTTVVGAKSSVPLNGSVHVAYDGPRNTITLRQTTIRTPKSSLLANGQIGAHSNLIIRANTSDLHELTMLASLAQSSKSAATTKYPDVSGTAGLSGSVTGSLQKPIIEARLNSGPLVVNGSEWRSLNLSARATSSGINIQDGSLVSERQGTVTFAASAGLRNWSHNPSDPILAKVSLKQLQALQIEQSAGVHYPVEGNLSGEITLHGSEIDPVGNGSLQLTQARISSEPVQNLSLQFRAANGSIASSLNVATSAGSANAKLTFIPKSKHYKFMLDAPGIVLGRLQTVQAKNIPLAGTVTASANGEGTIDDPQMSASIQLPKLQLRENSITGVKAELNVANQKANLAISSDVAQSTVRAHATVNMAGDYYTDASIDTTTIPLEPLLAMFVSNPPDGFQGATELHATLKGPLKDKSRIEAHAIIPNLKASYQALQVGNVAPIRIDYANAVLALQPSEIKGTGSDLQIQARMPMSGSAAMSATAKGTVDLRLLQIISSDIRTEGLLTLDVHSQGPTTQPNVQGQIQLKDASFNSPAAPLGLAHANGTFDVGTKEVRITHFSGQTGGGEISAGGSITYRPQVSYNVALKGRSIRLLYPEGLRTVLSSDLGLSGSIEDAALEGRVLIESLSFTPDFDMASFMGQFSGANVPPTGQSFTDNIKLNVSIQSTGQLAASSSQVSLQGQANLRAVGTASDPVIVGRADLNSGDIFFLNNRYQLQRGVFTFNNPNQTEPTVNVAATTTIQQYNLTINVNGPLDKLQTSYVSDPPLSTVDIINLIGRGQTTQQADTTNFSANSVIAQGVASKLSSGVQKLAGLSSLSIDPLLGGNNTNPSARIAVQQRLTKNFFFTFSTDVTQPQSEIIQGEYQLNRRWSVSANRDASGGVAVDGKFHTTF